MKKRFFIAYRNELTLNGTTLELQFMDGFYDTWDWNTWEEISLVQQVIDKVRDAKPTRIVSLINSYGGSCDIGIAVYNYLKNMNDVERETRVLAVCGSIATLVPMAASPGKRYIAKSASMVIHKASGGGWGNAKDLRDAADIVDRYTNTITDIYIENTGNSREQIEEMLAVGDFWMSGQEAVNLGFADALIEDVEGFSFLNAVEDLDTTFYKNIPKPVQLPPAPVNVVTEEDAELFLNKHKPFFMSFKKSVNAFIDSMKGKKVNPEATNLAEEVANQMADPMNDLATGFQEHMDSTIAALRTELLTEANTAATTQITALQTTIDAQAKLIEDLTTEISDNKGAGMSSKNDETINGIVPIGVGTKKA